MLGIPDPEKIAQIEGEREREISQILQNKGEKTSSPAKVNGRKIFLPERRLLVWSVFTDRRRGEENQNPSCVGAEKGRGK